MLNVIVIGSVKFHPDASHYSDTKAINLAIGFKNIGCNVFMLVDGDHFGKAEENNITLINIREFQEKIREFHLVIFTREQWVVKWIKRYDFIKDLLYNKNKFKRGGIFPLIIARYGTYGWWKDICTSINEFYEMFDIHFPQTTGICRRFAQQVPGQDTWGKILSSPMSVPSVIPEPYETPPFVKSKYTFIYMGRLRHVPTRYDFMVKVMNNLGSNFKLIIFPGSFSYDGTFAKLNPGIDDNLMWLKNRFSEAPNIEVLKPLPWGEHWKWIQCGDYGFDLTPSTGRKGTGGGNAKLLEFMRAGLPTVTEAGVENCYLLSRAKGGVLVNANNVRQYVVGMQKLVHTEWDREEMKRRIIITDSWEARASEILDNISVSLEISLWAI